MKEAIREHRGIKLRFTDTFLAMQERWSDLKDSLATFKGLPVGIHVDCQYHDWIQRSTYLVVYHESFDRVPKNKQFPVWVPKAVLDDAGGVTGYEWVPETSS